MRDQLYEMMKQVGDPTVFTEMLNEAANKLQEEQAAAEQKNVELDNARYEAAAAVVDYIELLFGIEEQHAGEKDELIDKICDVLEEAEAEFARTKAMLDMFKASKHPAQLKHDAHCDGHCEKCGLPEPEKVIDTPEAHIEVHKIPVRKDIDVDTVINEFLKSLQ